MKTVTVDPQHRIRIGECAPHTKFWLIPDEKGFRLQRIPTPEPKRRPSKEEAIKLIEKHRVKLSAGWEEIRRTTREID